MFDYRQMTRASGLRSQPYKNLRPAQRFAQRFGGRGFRSGAYDRAAAQQLKPIQAQMNILRFGRSMDDLFRKHMRKMQERRMEEKTQMMGLEGLGGISSDLAQLLSGRAGQRPRLHPELEGASGTDLETLIRLKLGQPVTDYMGRHGRTEPPRSYYRNLRRRY